MDRPEKALLAVPLLALAVWRFIRYMQFGSRVPSDTPLSLRSRVFRRSQHQR